MKRALPLLAVVAAVGLVVLLVGSSDRSKAPGPAPAPDVTTSTTARPSVLVRWVVPRGTRATSVVDLERHHPVLQVAPADPTSNTRAGVFDQADVDGVARTARFSVSVRVAGDGRVGLFLRARSFEGAIRDAVPDLAVVITPDADWVRAGRWQRLTVELALPKGTARLIYGVSFDGGGSVLVDEADDL
ncbi:MAG: hypothetical protein JWN67_3334 [Actinomycetia bacterium]|nr:hypothetical protein [Actinomycetes bacterium]